MAKRKRAVMFPLSEVPMKQFGELGGHVFWVNEMEFVYEEQVLYVMTQSSSVAIFECPDLSSAIYLALGLYTGLSPESTRLLGLRLKT